METKQQLQKLNNQLDKLRHQQAAAKKQNDAINVARINRDIEVLQKKIEAAKGQQNQQLSSKGSNLKNMAFNRTLSKAEQGDMGKFKKTVKGLIIVHPLTALGREMKITEVTGFAPKQF